MQVYRGCEGGVTLGFSHSFLTGQKAASSSQPCCAFQCTCMPTTTSQIDMTTPTLSHDAESTFHHLTGYPSLAAFIASDRDRSTLIYKRFDELAARNLLYLQSELAELHSKQRAFDQEDLTADLPTKQCARNFADFRRSASANGLKQKERWEVVKQVRETLKEYREALLFESTLAALPPPSKRTMRAFRQVYYNQAGGKGEPFPTLGGSSAGLYDDIDDLVALRVQETSDRLSNFAHERLGFFFPVSHQLRGDTRALVVER
jgi:hypothetical protein